MMSKIKIRHKASITVSISQTGKLRYTTCKWWGQYGELSITQTTYEAENHSGIFHYNEGLVKGNSMQCLKELENNDEMASKGKVSPLGPF